MWLWVRIPLLSLKLQIWRLLRARSSLTFRQTIECRFTLKLVHDFIITYSLTEMALEIDVSIFKDALLYAYNLLLATDGFLKFLVYRLLNWS